MKEVWLNLLDNAAKFSPVNGTISIVLREDETGNKIVSITDQGVGMDEHTIKHIFDQFFQGDTSHKTLGNGLGLTMVKKILNLHNANIQIDSKPGQGSCFIVLLHSK